MVAMKKRRMDEVDVWLGAKVNVSASDVWALQLCSRR